MSNLATSPNNVQVVGLMYHNVCTNRGADGGFPGFEALSPSITSYFVDEVTFERHCQLIASSERAINFDQLNNPNSEDSGFNPRVLLTFDDGWRGTVDVGGPVLEKHGLHGLLFVTTDLIGHPDFVSLETLRQGDLPFSVGSHGMSHRLLAELSDADVEQELAGSKSLLEDILGKEVDSLAYPGGSYDGRVQEIARNVGYRWIFTSKPHVSQGTSDRLQMGRLAVKSNTSDEMIARWLCGDVRREQTREIVLSAAKRVMGRRFYRSIRTRLLSEQRGQLEMTDLSDQFLPAQVK